MNCYFKLPFLLLILMTSTSLPASDETSVASILDKLHQSASNADADAYFQLFTDDAIFIGTDVNEYWTVEQFKSYAMPHFDKGKGWTYSSRNRDIRFSESGDVAWFHEVLDSENYGTSRGTGVLILGKDGQWRVSQYHLTFPIPNDLAVEFTNRIKEFEAGQSER